MSGAASPGNDDDRLIRVYAAVARNDATAGPLHRLRAICETCIEVLGVSGAGVMLMAERAHQGTLFATDERIGRLEDLQNAAAEGPCIDSYNLGRPVFAPDLADGALRTWPLLSASALNVGISALFSFPLLLDDTSIGALDLYRDRPGPLTDVEVADARLLAAMTTREVLTLQEDAPPGSLPEQVTDLSGDRAAIEQATGMVAAQTNTTIVEAARRVRAAAAQQSRPLPQVAHDIVARRLRLADDN